MQITNETKVERKGNMKIFLSTCQTLSSLIFISLISSGSLSTDILLPLDFSSANGGTVSKEDMFKSHKSNLFETNSEDLPIQLNITSLNLDIQN